MKNSKHLAFLSGLLACTMPLQAASNIQFTPTPTVYQVAENAGTFALTVQRTDDVDNMRPRPSLAVLFSLLTLSTSRANWPQFRGSAAWQKSHQETNT